MALYEAKQAAVDLNATPLLDEATKAAETPNAGSNYEKMVSQIKTAQELYAKGLVGTDDCNGVQREHNKKLSGFFLFPAVEADV